MTSRLLSLKEIAKEIKENGHKKQLIYAFNSVGKTRLSIEFANLFREQKDDNMIEFLYYNAFTEDLFIWDNDNLILQIKPNSLTKWIFEERGLENYVINNFQKYNEINNNKLIINFNHNFSEISFKKSSNKNENIKVSKGEESNFIWSIFYTLLKEINEIQKDENNLSERFYNLKYVFIDDPVSSLDNNNLIALAVELADVIKKSNLKFIITTHNILFYNILYNELGLKKQEVYILEQNGNDLFKLENIQGDSNARLSYHLYLKKIIEKAIQEKSIERYHFVLLRNLYESTANFLGYCKWGDLLPDDKKESYARTINSFSHYKLQNEVSQKLTEYEKNIVKFLLEDLIRKCNFYQNSGK